MKREGDKSGESSPESPEHEAPPGTKPRLSTGLRILRAAAVAILSLLVLYLVAMNVFLSTSLFQKVVGREPETIDIHYTRGWSLVPGRIHARNLSIRGRDSNVEWILRLDEADFDVSFFQLARMRFTVPRVHGTGISMRIRSRLEKPPAAPEEVAGLPPIDGLPPWSVVPTDVDHSDRWSDEAYKLWTAHLEHVRADDVRELWIDHVRFEGHADIQGRFFFKPIRVVDIGPAHVVVREGRVTHDGTLVVEPVHGKVDVTVAPLDPRDIPVAEALHRLSVDSDLVAAVPELATVPLSLPGKARVAGRADIDRFRVRVERGVVRAGSDADVRVTGAEVSIADHVYGGGDVHVHADVSEEGAEPRLDFQTDVHGLVISARASPTAGGRPTPLLRAPVATAKGDGGELDLATFLRDLHVLLDLPSAEVPDAHALDAFVPKDTPVSIVSGEATARAHFEAWFADKKTRGDVHLSAHALDLRLAKLRLRGDVGAEAAFGSFLWESSRLDDVHAGVQLNEGRLASDDAPDAPFIRAKNLSATGHATVIDLDDPLRSLELQVRLPEGELLDRGLLSKDTRIQEGHARFSLGGDLVIAEHRARGTVDLSAPDLGLTSRDATIGAALEAHARVHDWQWQRGDLALDEASVSMTKMTVARVGEPFGTAFGSLKAIATSPHFSLSDPLSDVRLSLVADVPDARAISKFMPADSLVAIDAGRLSVSAYLALSSVRRSGDGHVEVVMDNAGLRFHESHVAGDLRFLVNVKGYNPDGTTLDVSGSRFEMRNIAVARASTPINEWNGDLVFDDGKLQLFPELRLDSHVALGARDAKVLLALILRNDVPRLFAPLVEMPELGAEARLTIGTRRLALRELDARGGSLSVRGLMGARGEHKRGAFIVQKGPISAGLRMDDEKTEVRVFGLEGWLDEQRRAVVKLVDGPDPRAPAGDAATRSSSAPER